MSEWRACRFCLDRVGYNHPYYRIGFQYGPRHHAHFECFQKAKGKEGVLKLKEHQLRRWPWKLLQEAGILDEVAARLKEARS